MTGPTPRQLGYRMPAEWEPQDAVWLAWPHNPDTWRGDHLRGVRDTYIETIAALAGGQRVCLLVNDADAESDVRARLAAAAVEAAAVTILRLPTRDTWIRDYGPTFVVNDASGTVAIVKWEFNAWGRKYVDLVADTGVPHEMNRHLQLPIFEPGIVLEGGSIEVNGAGTVLTTEQCLLNPNRNPGLGRPEVEAHLREYLNVSTVVWLGDGIAGDDTDGHIDDVARFVDARTIVCVVPDDPAHQDYAPLAENLARLRQARDQDGRPFTVVPLPTPDRVADSLGPLPASYANFYIGNQVVLVPTFASPADARALTVLQRCFPGRRVAGVDCREMVAGLGALHCCSQQQPKAG
jgi:agmatine deiminase